MLFRSPLRLWAGQRVWGRWTPCACGSCWAKSGREQERPGEAERSDGRAGEREDLRQHRTERRTRRMRRESLDSRAKSPNNSRRSPAEEKLRLSRLGIFGSCPFVCTLLPSRPAPTLTVAPRRIAGGAMRTKQFFSEHRKGVRPHLTWSWDSQLGGYTVN